MPAANQKLERIIMCEKKVPVLNSMIKNRNTRFLKSYTLNYTNTEGNEKLYEMVSNFDYEKPEEIGQNASGVVIVGFRDDELLLLREFRMGVNQFIYNMPAGHSEDGESVEECARRELREETGLHIKKICKILPPAYAAPDLSDSSAWVVIAEVEGEFNPQTEADEYIQPLFAILIVVANAGHCLRLPYNIMILAGGHYKQTQRNYIIAAIINIVISIVAVKTWGLVGVAIGTAIAMFYQTIWMAFYDSKNLIKWPFTKFLKQIAVDFITVFFLHIIANPEIGGKISVINRIFVLLLILFVKQHE